MSSQQKKKQGGNKINIYDTEYRWKELFLGKHVEGDEITDVEVIGPPSFVYGSIKIICRKEGFYAPQHPNQYRPSIKNMKKIVDEYKEADGGTKKNI